MLAAHDVLLCKLHSFASKHCTLFPQLTQCKMSERQWCVLEHMSAARVLQCNAASTDKLGEQTMCMSHHVLVSAAPQQEHAISDEARH